jgi:filamentous hemagglutinin family protein
MSVRVHQRSSVAKRFLVGFLIYLIGAWPTIVFALPQDGQVVGGSGTITEPTATSMQVDQHTSQMIVNWQSFNIGATEHVNFTQPSSSSVALNRVIGSDPSLLLGKLTANGQVFITNGSGVFFGPGSQVDVHGLVATTMDISNQDFLDRNYQFTQDLDNPLSSVINEGTISATSYVGLLAPAVENRGTIVTASLGSIDLASGTAATMDFTGDGLIQFEVTQAVSGTVLDKDGNELEDRVSNTGLLHADGGQIRMSAKDAGDVIRHVVNMEGMIKANSVVEKNGKVFLMGGDSGVVNVSGTIDASGDDAGEKGGEVVVLGEKVGLFDQAKIDASGDAGGGEILLGGEQQGATAIEGQMNADFLYMDDDVEINADALTNGDGGRIITWATDTNRAYANIYARGGALSGDGGFVEISGGKYFEIGQVPDVTAANGTAGHWLIDPTGNDLSIVAGGGNTNINAANPFATTNDAASVGWNLILAALIAGTSVTVTTTTSGTNSESGNINVLTDLDYNGIGTGKTLTLTALGDITFSNKLFDSSGTDDVLNLNLNSGGAITFNESVDTNAGTITAVSVGDITQGALGTLSSTSAVSLSTSAGSITISQTLAAGSLILDAQGTISDININNTVTVTTGDATLTADDSIMFSASGVLNATGAGNVSLTSNNNVADGNNGDAIDMASGSSIDAGSGTILLTSTGTNSGSILLAQLTTTSASDTAVTLTVDTASSILDNNGDTTADNVSAVNGRLVIDATNGVGSANALEIDVASVDIDNTSSNSIVLEVNGSIDIVNMTSANQITINAGGAITQTGLVSATGNSSFTVTGTNVITLTNASNDFTGTVSLNSGTGAVQLTDSTDTIFAASTLGGALTVISAGNITQSGALAVTGTSAFTVSSSNTMTLTNASNDFTGAVTLTSDTGAVQLTDSTDTILAASTIGSGGLTVISSGTITQTGDLAVTGNSAFTVSGANALTLTNAANIFTGAVTLNSGTSAVQLTDSTDTILAASTLGGNLTLISSGNITQTGALAITGTSSFTVSGSSAITLSNASNTFTGGITLSAETGAIAMTDNSDTTITSVTTTGGSFSLFTTTGNISLVDDAINTTSGNIDLTASAGSINDSDGGTTVSITTTGTIFLGAGTNIGGTDQVEISTAVLTISAGQTTDIDSATALTSLTMGLGSGGSFTHSITASNVTASFAQATDMTINSMSSTGMNFSLQIASGNLLLANSAISAGTGNVTLTAVAGNINESIINTMANITTTGAISLTGLLGVGNTSTLDVAGSSNLSIDTDNSFDVDTGAGTTLTDLSISVNPANTSTYALNVSNISNMTSFNLADSSATNISSSGIVATGLDLSLNIDSGSFTNSGAINVGTNSLSITANLSLDNAILISGTIDAGSLVLDANGQDADVQINNDIDIVGGAVVITADDSVIFGLAKTLTATGVGDVTIQSNTDSVDGTGSDVISMVSGSSIDAGSGTITLTSTGTGAGNISLGLLSTTSSSSTAINVTADNGVSGTTITDNNAASTNISAVNGGVVLVARSSIGGTSDATALEVDADTLDATNFSNSIFLNLVSDVSISNLSIISQANFSGTGNITQTGSITATALTANVTGSVTLENISNNVTSVSLSATGDISYVDTDDFNVNTTNSVVGVSTSGGSINLSTTGSISATQDITVSAGTGTVALTADSDKDGTGDLTIGSGDSVNSNNGAITLQGADIDLSLTTDAMGVDSGTSLTTLNFTKNTTGDGTNTIKITASALTINVTGDLTVNGVTSAELGTIGSGTGLLTLYASNDLNFSTTASDHNGAVTLEADNDITLNVDVTSAGDFKAEADHDNNGTGDFTLATARTLSSTSGDVDITAVAITNNGIISASSGAVTLTETSAITEEITPEVQESIDQGQQAGFADSFITNAADGGC